MNGNKKIISVDGTPTELVEFQRGALWVWVRDPDTGCHILPVRFWDMGTDPRYRTKSTVYELPGTVGKDQTLIQRIEYALHSRYDADNRQLLEESLVALKEKT